MIIQIFISCFQPEEGNFRIFAQFLSDPPLLYPLHSHFNHPMSPGQGKDLLMELPFTTTGLELADGLAVRPRGREEKNQEPRDKIGKLTGIKPCAPFLQELPVEILLEILVNLPGIKSLRAAVHSCSRLLALWCVLILPWAPHRRPLPLAPFPDR